MSDPVPFRQLEAIAATTTWFSSEMVDVLKRPENLARGPWDYCSDVYLFNRLTKSLEDIRTNLQTPAIEPSTLQARIKECADVANIAMFIASNAFHLKNEMEEDQV